MGPFGSMAAEYAARNLRPFPTGGSDGKRPLIRGWRRLHLGAVSNLSRRFPSANIGVLDGDAGTVAHSPRKNAAKILAAENFCADHDRTFIYLDDSTPEFVEMCEWVSTNLGVDLGRKVAEYTERHGQCGSAASC